jgi:general transcription factor 3C polypeptide 3 (transcription factor C subunit 4)
LNQTKRNSRNLAHSQRHFEILFYEDVSYFPELFGAVAQAYFDRKMYDQALDVYQLIAENEETNGPTVWSKIAACRSATGDWEDAKECYENGSSLFFLLFLASLPILNCSLSSVIAEEPDNVDAKLALAKVLEQLGEASRALQLIKDGSSSFPFLRCLSAADYLRLLPVISVRRKTQKDPAERAPRRPWKSKDERSATRINAENAEQARHAEFVEAFSQLSALDEEVAMGSEEAVARWLEIATRLVESFRSTKPLFPYDHKKKFVGMQRKRKKRSDAKDVDLEADQMADRLQQTLGSSSFLPFLSVTSLISPLTDLDEDNEVEETTFRGLHFDEWVDFILQVRFPYSILPFFRR